MAPSMATETVCRWQLNRCARQTTMTPGEIKIEEGIPLLSELWKITMRGHKGRDHQSWRNERGQRMRNGRSEVSSDEKLYRQRKERARIPPIFVICSRLSFISFFFVPASQNGTDKIVGSWINAFESVPAILYRSRTYATLPIVKSWHAVNQDTYARSASTYRKWEEKRKKK